eukprot:scaffold27400_cov140-Isochrysis_galbana.AAC.1
MSRRNSQYHKRVCLRDAAAVAIALFLRLWCVRACVVCACVCSMYVSAVCRVYVHPGWAVTGDMTTEISVLPLATGMGVTSHTAQGWVRLSPK